MPATKYTKKSFYYIKPVCCVPFGTFWVGDWIINWKIFNLGKFDLHCLNHQSSFRWHHNIKTDFTIRDWNSQLFSILLLQKLGKYESSFNNFYVTHRETKTFIKRQSSINLDTIIFEILISSSFVLSCDTTQKLK
jgi:hypothetical protein